MNTIYIDFSEIGDYEDFYAQLKEKISVSEGFGDNLDALYDAISGDFPLPMHLEFVNMSVEQLEDFEELLGLLEETEEEMEDFSFAYFLEQYED